MPPRVNLRSSAVKRIMQEASEKGDPDTDGFVATPLDSDIFEWHCTLRGVAGTEFEEGLYHLRILLPASYPMSAPDIVLLTPNGRFELDKKICIDGLTSFHAGSWQPAWGVRTAITGLRAFWGQDGDALSAIGALDVPKDERRRLAKLSRGWTCSTCGESNEELLPDPAEGSGDGKGEGVGEEASDEPVSEGPAPALLESSPLAASVGSSQAAPEPVLSEPTELVPSAPVSEPDGEQGEPTLEPAGQVAAAQVLAPEVMAPTPAPAPATAPAPAAAPAPAVPAPAVAPTPARPAIPARFTTPAAPLPRRLTPLWLDALIAGLMALLLGILLRHGI